MPLPTVAARPWRVLALALALAAVLAAAPGAGAQTRGSSPSFTVYGSVDPPRGFTLAARQALPAQEVAVEFASGSTRERHTYRGPLLVDVLNATRPMFDASRRNDNLRWYATIHATDGYEAVIA